MKKKTEIERIYSLSPMQEGILFHYLMDKESHAYFEQSMFTLAGEVVPGILEESFNRILQRYDVLRSIFRFEKVKKPLQVVLKSRRLKLQVEDISSMDIDAQEKYLGQEKSRDRDRGFDLAKDLLMRVVLYITGSGSSRLLWSFHHILMDGWCLQVIFKDLARIYRALLDGQEPQLEPVPAYADYIEWLKQQDREEALKEWAAYLEGYEQVAVLPKLPPGKKTGVLSRPYEVAEYSFQIDEYLAKALNNLARDNQTTLSIVFETLWGLLLQKYNNSDDVVYGAVVSTRPVDIPGAERMVGLFINTVPVRIQSSVDRVFRFVSLVQATRDQDLHLKPYHYLSLADIQGCSLLKGQLFDMVIGFENYAVVADTGVQGVSSGQLQVVYRDMFEQTTYDFNVMIIPGGSLTVIFNYNTGVYRHGVVENIAGHLLSIIHQVVEEDRPVSQVELVTRDEKQRLLDQFNGKQVAFPGERTIHEWFGEQAEKYPDQPAVSYPIEMQDIFAALENEPGVLTLNASQVERLRHSYFQVNPFIFATDLEFPGVTGLKLLKTESHHTVVVETGLWELMESFTGQVSLGELFEQSCEKEVMGFLLYPATVNDLLEITVETDQPARVFSVTHFSGFLQLVQALYSYHLVRLMGIEAFEPVLPGEEEKEVSVRYEPGGVLEGKTPLKLSEMLERHSQDKQSRLSTVDVLLVGDTPGMASTGILYLGAYLRRHGLKVACQFNDSSVDYASMKANMENLLRHYQPGVVAVSMKWFLYIARVFDLCKTVKDFAVETGKTIKVVLGGNTVSYYWEEVIQNPYVDYIIRGDGEEPLLQVCRDPENPGSIGNVVYKVGGDRGSVIANPVTYVQDESHSSGIYLSHLSEILLSDYKPLFGTFFIYTHKGCMMNCLYCGGCREAQRRAFNRDRVMRRGVEEVRKDIIAALPYTSTFQFDFAIPGDERLVEYCREIWTGIDLSSHFCIYTALTLPSTPLLELVQKTFKYVYCDIDITTLSERHRLQLMSEGLIKPQPTDNEIRELMARGEGYENIEVRINLITGLPYFAEEDIVASEAFLAELINTYRCFGELHWARLHAQPGAPVVETAVQYDMHTYASTYEDFYNYSKKNYNSTSDYRQLEYLHYPYIYFNDDRFNSRVTRFYSENNQQVLKNKDKKRRRLVTQTLTYSQLHIKSRQLAVYLQEKGVKPGSIVGLMLERSLDIMVGILGILNAGGAYLPVDPEYPWRRVQYMLNDSHSQLLITQPQFLHLGDNQVEMINIRDSEIYGRLEYFQLPGVSAQDLVYTIYTSGTTGQSKGVAVTHGNLVNYIDWFVRKAELDETAKGILSASYAFDLGYTTLYPPLMVGGQLHILPREIYLSAENLLGYIKEKGITYIKMTPSLFASLVKHPGFSAVNCKTLRLATIGGEAIDVMAVVKAYERCPGLRVMNHYGPTEATIGCVAQLIDSQELESFRATPVIGSPIDNMGVVIIDRHGGVLPYYVPGELCISGTGLARGYLNRPGLTADKFINIDVGVKGFQRFYASGDLCRWLPDGTIEFLGRIDHQVKVRGYRVELGEIENRLLTHPQIKKATVLTRDNEEGHKYICAYIVTGQKVSGGIISTGTYRYVSPESIGSILMPFEKEVKEQGERVAISCSAGDITYQSLDSQARQLAGSIEEKYDDRFMLSGGENTRYKRQMLLANWGMSSQEKLKQTVVFVAGAGGGASPTIMQLALAGFGTIIVCDCDTVELSNLNRQFLHNESRLGMNKALSAQMTIQQVNPHVHVLPVTERLTRENVFQLVGESAVIFDMFDGLESKFILSECATALGIPHIISAMTDMNSYAAVFHTPYTPCYHCIFDRERFQAIAQGMRAHVRDYEKNPLAVVATSLFLSTGFAVNEAIKIILGFEEPAYNKYFFFNQRRSDQLVNTQAYRAMTHAYSQHFRDLCREQGFDWEIGWRGRILEELDILPDPGCPVCSEQGKEYLQSLKERALVSSSPVYYAQEVIGIGGKDKAREERVALLMDNDATMALGMLGALKAGKTVVPLSPHVQLNDLVKLLVDGQVRVIVTTQAYLELAEALRERANKNIKIIETMVNGKTVMLNRAGDHEIAANPRGFPERSAALYYLSKPGEIPRVFAERFPGLLTGEGWLHRDSQPGEKNAPVIEMQLREFLLQELPEYMIPSYIIPVAEIPLTPNGKVDRNALPEPGVVVEEKTYEPPQGEIEEILVKVWSEVLGIEKMGATDNFFEKGLDSIKAIQVTAALTNYQLKLEIADIFSHPTIRQLNSYVMKDERVIDQGIVSGEVVLTPIQCWFFENHFTDAHHFNMSVMVYREEGFEENCLREAFFALIEHHDALRMVFETRECENELTLRVRQINRGYDPGVYDLEVVHLEDEDDNELAALVQAMAERVQKSLDISSGPLIKPVLFRTALGDHVLIVVHHLVIDGVSWRILLEDLESAYRQAERGEVVRLAKKSDSFKKWAARLLEYAGSAKALAELDYWRTVEETQVKRLPGEGNQGEPQGKFKHLETITLELTSEDTRKLLTDVHRPYNTEINDILLTAIGLAVKNWAGVERPGINLEGHGREMILTDIEIGRTVGWFTSQYPVVLPFETSNSIGACIKRVKETLHQVPNKGIGYGILKYLTPVEKKKGMVFSLEPEINFNYLGEFVQHGAETIRRGLFTMSPLDMGNSISLELEVGHPLNISGMVMDGKLKLSFSFIKGYFSRAAMEQLVEHCGHWFTEIINHCLGRNEKNETEMTPSDFTKKNLDEHELENILDLVGSL